MRKLLALILLVLLIICCGCDQSYFYSYDDLMESVEKIEIINVHQFKPERDIEVLYTLNKDEMQEFLTEYSKIEFIHSYGAPNTNPEGLCIRIHYTNQDYGFFNHNAAIKFRTDGTRFYEKNLTCPKDEFDALLSEYTS